MESPGGSHLVILLPSLSSVTEKLGEVDPILDLAIYGTIQINRPWIHPDYPQSLSQLPVVSRDTRLCRYATEELRCLGIRGFR